jgi:hypothetical protein
MIMKGRGNSSGISVGIVIFQYSIGTLQQLLRASRHPDFHPFVHTGLSATRTRKAAHRRSLSPLTGIDRYCYGPTQAGSGSMRQIR